VYPLLPTHNAERPEIPEPTMAILIGVWSSLDLDRGRLLTKDDLGEIDADV
jgi:hypothetical protein